MAKKKVRESEPIRTPDLSEIEKTVRETVGQENFNELCMWAFELAYHGAPYHKIARMGKPFEDFARKERDNMLLEIYQDLQKNGFPKGSKITRPDSKEVARIVKESYTNRKDPRNRVYGDTT